VIDAVIAEVRVVVREVCGSVGQLVRDLEAASSFLNSVSAALWILLALIEEETSSP
jgi:hypothetical protein